MFSPVPVLLIGIVLALSAEGIFLRVTLHNGTTHFGVAGSNPGLAARAGSGAASVAGAAAHPAGAPPGNDDLLRLVLPDGGVVELPRASIAREEVVRGRFVGGAFWPSDPNASRLFLAATGRSPPAGTGTFNACYGLIPFVGVGLTDQVSIAGGTPLYFAEREGEGRLFHVAPKLQVLRASAPEWRGDMREAHGPRLPRSCWKATTGPAAAGSWFRRTTGSEGTPAGSLPWECGSSGNDSPPTSPWWHRSAPGPPSSIPMVSFSVGW